MQSVQLETLLTQLSDIHKAIHDAFMVLPNGASVDHPVLYHATSAAASSVSNAYDSFRALSAVLEADEPDVRGCSCGEADFGAPGHDHD